MAGKEQQGGAERGREEEGSGEKQRLSQQRRGTAPAEGRPREDAPSALALRRVDW